jgi:hypothetical protein
MATIARGAKLGGGTNFNSGQTIDPSEVNTDFNTVYTEINGNLDDANIETATVPGAKSLRFTEISAPSSPSSNDIVVYGADDGAGVTRVHTKDASGNVLALGYTRLLGTGTQTATTGGVMASTAVGSVGTDADTSEKVLHTITVSANSVTTNGDTIAFTFIGATAANGNNKTIRLRVGGVAGTEVLSSGTVAANGRFWNVTGHAWRTAAATGICEVTITLNTDAGSPPVTVHRFTRLAITPTWADGTTIDVTGQNGTATANDVTCGFSKGQFLPAVT